MESVKKYSIQTIAIIVLSVLLAISVAVGGTMAWFADKDTATGTLTMGGAVNIDIYDKGADSNDVTFTLPGDADVVVPSMAVAVDTTVMVAQTTTPVFLRAKVDVQVSGVTDADGTIKNQFVAEVAKLANGKGWYIASDDGDSSKAGGYFYYTTTAATLSSNLTAVDASGSAKEVEFMVGDLIVPSSWTNTVAGATVTFTVNVEAIQGLIYDTDGKTPLTSIEKVAPKFTEAAAQPAA